MSIKDMDNPKGEKGVLNMRTEIALIRIARQSGRSIVFSEEDLKIMKDYIDHLIVIDETLLPFHKALLEELENLYGTFKGLGMSFDEYTDYKKEEALKHNYIHANRHSICFNRPAIRHQVIDRKPKNLIKKIIH